MQFLRGISGATGVEFSFLPHFAITEGTIVDSETICPVGETMVPIDDYACGQIAQAGRINQISQPVNGESNIVCPGESSPRDTSAMMSTATSTPSMAVSVPAASHYVSSPKIAETKTSLMHLTCNEVGGETGSLESGQFFMLNCTMSG